MEYKQESRFRAPLVVGYPRTGFTLLISVIAEIFRYPHCGNQIAGRNALKTFCDTAGLQIPTRIEQVFQRRGLAADLLYNNNFRQMVGGPKWLKEGNDQIACFRKYIGVRGKGDFTLITSHPRQVLDYYEIIHSHAHPARWAAHPAYGDFRRFASIRHPAGTIASACFSLNALSSEYIQRFVAPEDDNDAIRQRLALYKLSDLNFFEALIAPFKAYLEEFDACADRYFVMRWEDLIQEPVRTIQTIADAAEIPVDADQAADIWRRLDHINLTGAHLHNLRKGHGVVGGWRRWLTNTHLDMLRDYGLEVFSRKWGYGVFESLDENIYTPFQKQLASAIKDRKIIREYDDEDLFGFAFNKSNLDLNRFNFKRYGWRAHTQIERSSCADEDLVMDVWDVAESACGMINRALDWWFDSDALRTTDKQRTIETIAAEISPLFADAAALSAWKQEMLGTILKDDAGQPGATASAVPRRRPDKPVLLESIGTTNIVIYSGEYYALPQCLGPVDFYTQDVASLPGVIVTDSLSRLKSLLSKGIYDPGIKAHDSPLLFLHIPRTGGTSLISWLEQLYKKEEICPAHEMFEFEKLERAGRLEGYKFYRGHFGINFLGKFDKERAITFLRQPIDRVYSTWRHLRNSEMPFTGHESKPMIQQIQSDSSRARSLDFENFCHEIMNQGRMSFFNQMTVLLGMGRGWEVGKAGIPIVDDALCSAALENLDRMYFVGFTERFNNDFERLSLLLTGKIDRAPHLNSAPLGERKFSKEFNNWLAAATRFDRQLYETAFHQKHFS